MAARNGALADRGTATGPITRLLTASIRGVLRLQRALRVSLERLAGGTRRILSMARCIARHAVGVVRPAAGAAAGAVVRALVAVMRDSRCDRLPPRGRLVRHIAPRRSHRAFVVYGAERVVYTSTVAFARARASVASATERPPTPSDSPRSAISWHTTPSPALSATVFQNEFLPTGGDRGPRRNQHQFHNCGRGGFSHAGDGGGDPAGLLGIDGEAVGQAPCRSPRDRGSRRRHPRWHVVRRRTGEPRCGGRLPEDRRARVRIRHVPVRSEAGPSAPVAGGRHCHGALAAPCPRPPRDVRTLSPTRSC